jgi:hypothetical protein
MSRRLAAAAATKNRSALSMSESPLTTQIDNKPGPGDLSAKLLTGVAEDRPDHAQRIEADRDDVHQHGSGKGAGWPSQP